MLIARFFTGFGAGTLGVLRSFVATASTRSSRIRAISMGTAGLTTGLSIGPAIQILFIPLGNAGFFVGPLLFNMYTSAAFFMFLINIISIFVVHIVLVEDYVGIISDDEKKEDPFLVIPKFDRVPVLLLFYMWWMLCGVASTEGLAAPITIAMYNWTNEEAVLYNGIIQVISCGVSTLGYTIIGSTRIGTWDRRLVVAMGLLGFWYSHFCHYPLPFYEGPLTRPPLGILLILVNGTASVSGGGCPVEYEWCDYTPRVQFKDYLLSQEVWHSSPFLYFPRKKNYYSCTKSPLRRALFETSGYKYIMVYHLVAITLAGLMVFILRGRLVPLEMTPSAGKATKYKRGTFYRM
ncbi:hypothetical protein COOONC_09045 [Cooperia oncophora]